MKNEFSRYALFFSVLILTPFIHGDEQGAVAPLASTQSEELVASQKRQATERALEARRTLQDDVAARYSSTGDGKLTEDDRRRHAHDLFIQKNDLNGDGKVDQHELRAMAEASRQRKQKQADQKSASPAVESKKDGELAK